MLRLDDEELLLPLLLPLLLLPTPLLLRLLYKRFWERLADPPEAIDAAIQAAQLLELQIACTTTHDFGFV